MAIKLSHTCTRCRRSVDTEVQDLQAAATQESQDAQRAVILKELQEYLTSIDPELLPDLLVVRRGKPVLTQTFLCNDADAKRACAERVNRLVEECETFDPRKPKTKKKIAEAA